MPVEPICVPPRLNNSNSNYLRQNQNQFEKCVVPRALHGAAKRAS